MIHPAVAANRKGLAADVNRPFGRESGQAVIIAGVADFAALGAKSLVALQRRRFDLLKLDIQGEAVGSGRNTLKSRIIIFGGDLPIFKPNAIYGVSDRPSQSSAGAGSNADHGKNLRWRCR